MTNRYDLIKIQEKLQKKLTPDRYQHTLGVMYTCAALAMCHGCNLERAMVAGLLHDCAKCIPNDKKISICEKITLLSQKQNGKILRCFMQKPVYFLQNPNMTLKMRIFWMRFDIIQPEMSI
ncbi:MAG: HD domain-containing protein [Lachnospiraceae bacterium]